MKRVRCKILVGFVASVDVTWKATVALFFAVLLTQFGCEKPKPAGGSGRAPMSFSGAVTVQGTTVKRGPMTVTGDYSGDIRTDKQATLSSEINGRIRSVEVVLGDKVEKNQLLATVDRVELETRLTQARATYEVGSGSIAEAETVVENLKKQLARSRPLLEKKLMTPGEIESLEAQLTAAEQRVALAKANLKQSAAQLRSAKNTLSNSELRSPIAGEVAMRNVDIGNYVTPSQTLFRIVDPDDIYVSIRVPESQSGLITQGVPATVRVDALGGKSFAGIVKRIAPALDTATRTLQVDIVPQKDVSWDALLPGMFARVKVQLAERTDTLTVPTQAIRKTSDGAPYVWKVGDDHAAQKTDVVIGVSNSNNSEILSGLKEGDTVILRGQEKVRSDGSKVDLLENSKG